jgi:5-methylcytosine-specific restriction endonuclease McrA
MPNSDKQRMLISRSEAIALGKKYYFTGRPCKRGHLSERHVATRKCLECANAASLSYYYRNQKERQSKSREWRRKNPTKASDNSRQWYQKNIDANREKAKAYHILNKSRRNAYSRFWYDANKERSNATASEWWKNNPDKSAALWSKRRARLLNADGVYTDDDIRKIRLAQKDRCAYCKNRLGGRGSRDHIIPLSKGGSNWPQNIQLLCKPCNSKKHNRDPIEYAASLGLLI